jgi:hypothetical protein
VLPHVVKALDESDLGKRSVVTLFNCGPTVEYLKKHDFFPLDDSDVLMSESSEIPDSIEGRLNLQEPRRSMRFRAK